MSSKIIIDYFDFHGFLLSSLRRKSLSGIFIGIRVLSQNNDVLKRTESFTLFFTIFLMKKEAVK